jgi:hypothetical protein
MSKSLTPKAFYGCFGLSEGLGIVICGWFGLDLGLGCGGWLRDLLSLRVWMVFGSGSLEW